MNRVLMSAASIALLSGSALAFDVASFGFNDLAGDFDTTAAPAHPLAPGDSFDGVFMAVSSDMPGLRTGGSFSRLVGPEGTAEYLTGFESGGGPGTVTVTITVANNNGTTAKGVGNILIVDADGDQFNATFEGTWFVTGPFLFFNSIIDNADFSQAAGDGQFDGPTGGSFQYSDFGILDGAFSVLLRPNIANPLGNSFGTNSTLIDGLLIPAPGALALAGLGLVAAARRRR
jgi:hypothetical protein